MLDSGAGTVSCFSDRESLERSVGPARSYCQISGVAGKERRRRISRPSILTFRKTRWKMS